LEGRSTAESYSSRPWGTDSAIVAAQEREGEALDRAIQRALDLLAPLMLVEDDWGLRARRASEALRTRPIPEPVYLVAKAFGDNLAAIIYSRSTSDRARLARLLNELLIEATRIQSDRRAA
jgi:hypothetical protein